MAGNEIRINDPATEIGPERPRGVINLDSVTGTWGVSGQGTWLPWYSQLTGPATLVGMATIEKSDRDRGHFNAWEFHLAVGEELTTYLNEGGGSLEITPHGTGEIDAWLMVRRQGLSPNLFNFNVHFVIVNSVVEANGLLRANEIMFASSRVAQLMKGSMKRIVTVPRADER